MSKSEGAREKKSWINFEFERCKLDPMIERVKATSGDSVLKILIFPVLAFKLGLKLIIDSLIFRA